MGRDFVTLFVEGIRQAFGVRELPTLREVLAGVSVAALIITTVYAFLLAVEP